MKSMLSAQDVLSEIEFELIQGAIARNELGQGIAQVKEFQNRLRHELFQPGHDKPNWQEVAARQFQLNDMLLTLLQEIAAVNLEYTAQVRRQARWQAQRQLPPAPDGNNTGLLATADDDFWRDTADIQEAMTEKLDVKLEARPTNIPLLGAWVHRFKYEMHNLVIFYVRKLARRQTAVNQTYGEWLLYLDALNQHQDYQVRARLSELDRRLAKLESETAADA